jgi:cytochrome c-type biogenesis protein CcmH/NrfG
MNSRTPFLSRLPLSNSGLTQALRGPTGTWSAAAAVFLLVAGIGAATSYFGTPPETISASRTGSHDDTLARLKDYTRTVETNQPESKPEAGKMLPDVSTMIERLAARLETAPDDVKGWRMLGWSYFHTERYQQAASAYARAVQLDPNSAELKSSYEEAKAKAAGGGSLKATAPLPSVATGEAGREPDAKQIAAVEAMPAPERDAAIRSMVDGLADRLERSPRDVEGWTRLMRSRVVLGEREVAAAAFRKALDVFKGDTEASARIEAAAIEFGLKVE